MIKLVDTDLKEIYGGPEDGGVIVIIADPKDPIGGFFPEQALFGLSHMRDQLAVGGVAGTADTYQQQTYSSLAA